MATANHILKVLVPLGVLVFFFLALVPVCASAECTIHGNVYDWSTFNVLNNAIVEVYSLPDMSLTVQAVTKSGGYSFSLAQGSYMIKASSGTPGTPDEITAMENITVPGTGERIIDLILFPSSNVDDLSGYVDDNATATLSPTTNPVASPVPTLQPGRGEWTLYLGAGAILLAIVAIVAGVLFLRRTRPKLSPEPPLLEEVPHAASPPPAEPAVPPEVEKQEPSQQPPSPQELLLPQDCREVLAIMEKNGGRITQLDLRKALPYSEAKVSLIVSDLESRGLVKKIKKGRGNVLIMNRSGERPPE